MAAVLKQDHNIDANLIPGKGGEFEVTVDGLLVFSKKQAGRFPDTEEIVAKLSPGG